MREMSSEYHVIRNDANPDAFLFFIPTGNDILRLRLPFCERAFRLFVPLILFAAGLGALVFGWNRLQPPPLIFVTVWVLISFLALIERHTFEIDTRGLRIREGWGFIWIWRHRTFGFNSFAQIEIKQEKYVLQANAQVELSSSIARIVVVNLLVRASLGEILVSELHAITGLPVVGLDKVELRFR